MHHARATLKEQGYRLTPQRTAVWEALRGAGTHMTAEEVAGATRLRLPGIDTSTVYRTLELLVSLDLVTETKLGSARSYFEVSPDPGHHHFVCERCGAVGHFGDELFAPLYQALEIGDGFTPTRARATVFGVCRQCRDGAGGTAKPPVDGAPAARPADDGAPAPGEAPAPGRP